MGSTIEDYFNNMMGEVAQLTRLLQAQFPAWDEEECGKYALDMAMTRQK